MTISKEELEAWNGLNESYKEMDSKIKAPMCHFTPMHFESADYEEWWECPHCGHVKPAGFMDPDSVT